ncbi:MAG: hypothetical protein LBJ77_00995 [Holosporales bacterium]|nr:hypothetical protein [Holosporales bacterium]
MKRLILLSLSICGILEAAASRRVPPPNPSFLLPEVCEITQLASYSEQNGQLVSEAASQKFLGPTKMVRRDLLEAFDNFYEQCIVGAAKPQYINDFLQLINGETSLIFSCHQIVHSEVASSLISAGMARFLFPVEVEFTELVHPSLDGFFQFGFEIAELISQNPLELLRCEIYRDKIIELARDLRFTAIYEQLESSLFDLEKVFVPFTFLENVHTEQADLLNPDATMAALCPIELGEDGNPLTPRDIFRSRIFSEIVTTGSLLLTTDPLAQRRKLAPPSPFGYSMDDRKLPMIPNLIATTLTDSLGKTTRLNESTKKWLICKAAIRYLYENPMSTVEDAVEGSINMVQGMTSDSDHPFPLGSTISACKTASAELLNFLHARSLCQLGRWPDHCSLLRLLSQASGGKFRRYYYPDLKYIGHVDADPVKPDGMEGNELALNSAEFPVISRRLIAFNNHGAGNCGIYSTLFQSRADLVKWLRTVPAWEDFLPDYLKDGRSHANLSMHGQVNGIGTIIQTDGYLIRMGEILKAYSLFVLEEARTSWETQRRLFLALPPAEQKKQQKLHPGAKPWNERMASREYGGALSEVIQRMGCDFGYIAALHCRPMQLWQTKGASGTKKPTRATDEQSPENFTSLIIPDGFMERSVRSRKIHWWATPGHFMSLIEQGDFIGIAKLLRHQESGTAL